MQMTPSCDGQSVMVPLTMSLYVPGKIRDPTNVIVELGTGFYVQKPVKKAVEFLDRRADLAGKNAENVYNLVIQTRKTLEAIIMTMQGKMADIQRRQADARGGN